VLRVNQIGYPAHCSKVAFAMADRPLTGVAFEVLHAAGGGRAFEGRVGSPRPPFNDHWHYVYALDFGTLTAPGTYVVQLGSARSPTFAVNDARRLYAPLVRASVSYFQEQRDGPNVIPGPLHRQPAHLHDRQATVYLPPPYRGRLLVGNLVPTRVRVDVSGGWFDAGDYLKFAETTSFDAVALLFALREYPRGIAEIRTLRREGRFGLDWLLKLWDPARGVLYDQVGIGDGGGHILGDHDLWRLPQADDHRRVHPGSPSYFLSYRPVFAANAPGQKLSPNLAGRMAAAFGLCAQVFAAADPAYARRCLRAGQTIFASAEEHPRGPLTTAVPYGYYPEREWYDDMELGASELYLATRRLGGTGLPHPDAHFYVTMAAHWADRDLASPSNGSDSLNLYDVSPLAHFELVRILRAPEVIRFARVTDAGLPVSASSLVNDLRDQLQLARRLGRSDPFALSDPASPVDTVPHALGYAIGARLLEALRGRDDYEDVARAQLDWVLGANPWGSSYTVGAGSVFPHCLADPIANLSGSLTGRGAIFRGATVDGPTSLQNLGNLGAPDGFRPCPASGVDPFAGLTGRGDGYRDDVRSFSSSEPSNDYAALALLAAAQQAAR
jgi:hypothetical protein